MTNLINKLTKLAMIPILAGSLSGCRDNSNDFCKKGKYNGYDVQTSFDGFGKRIIINSDVQGYLSEKARIYGKENEYMPNLKGRFSQIQIDKEIPNEHPILRYANPDSLEKIYNFVYKNGENCE